MGKCNLYGMDKTLPISHKTQEALCPYYKELNIGETVNSEILNDCYVTLCRQKGKNFWLITKDKLERSRCLSIQYAQIEPHKLLSDWERYGFKVTVKLFHLFLYQQINDTKYSKYNIVNFFNSLYDYDLLPQTRKAIIDEALKDEVFRIVSQKEIQEFVYFVTHYKQFDRKQKLQRDRLLARDYAGKYVVEEDVETETAEENVFVAIDPKNTSTFLSSFNNPRGLKYLTHDFDNIDDGRPRTLEELKNQIAEIRMSGLPKSLVGLLKQYISIGKEWLDTFGNAHQSSLSNQMWVDWCNKNNNMHPINNPNFAPEIMAFRSTVRIDQGLLTQIVDKASEKTTLQILKEKTDSADFYTNTYILYLSLKKI